MKIIAVVSVLLFGGYWTYQQTLISKDDVYVDRLVYLKKDSTLFSGTLKVVGKASYYYENFCTGIPCGEWSEHQKGGSYVSRGKYLSVKETLSDSTLQILLNDTVILDYWQEGGDLPSDPYYLTLFILKDDAFFKTDKGQYDNYIQRLANALMNDTRNLKYNGLSISFANNVYDWTDHYRKSYELQDGKLIEVTN